jgi:small subunit ribosomal protein S13
MAARIAGINLNPQKSIWIALTGIYGIGRQTSAKILTEAGVDRGTKVEQLTNEDVDKLRQIIENKHKVEGDLKVQILQDIKRLKEIGSYRGHRHIKGLPLRGQRTKTNARTKRGKRVTVGSGRKKSAEKT